MTTRTTSSSLVLPRTDLDGAFAIAERIRSETAAEPVMVGSHPSG